jgi:uncharacterized protein
LLPPPTFYLVADLVFNPDMAAQPGFEWPATLDIAALIGGGWRPAPFSEFVIKIHSRCDLACDYCYMYEMADQSWRGRPRRMSGEIAERTAMRIGEHARAHRLASIGVVLHGGEPLLAGRDLITNLVTGVRMAAGTGVAVDTSVQTNGIGLDEAYLRLFDQLGVKIGVSLDGGARAHDRHRRFPSGRGSYAAVSAALRRLVDGGYQHLFSGLLCTIELRNDPVETYESLAAFGPPRIDFLLPHGTWESPPPGRIPGEFDTPYADWLIAIFDEWYTVPLTRVRLFEDIMHLILGGTSSTEAIGLAPSRVVVIETDGAIEQADMLKVAYPGAPETGLHVDRDPFDAALLTPGVAARQLGELALAEECRACRIRRICGGGLYTHRYRADTGFANPSVYCPDLMSLINHILQTMQADIQARLLRRETR